jgi:hypothetical protein
VSPLIPGSFDCPDSRSALLGSATRQSGNPRTRDDSPDAYKNELVEMTRSRVVTQTIRNRFHEREFNARRPAKVIPLSHEHRRARLFFKNLLTAAVEQRGSLTNPDSVCITLMDEFECRNAQGNGV